MCFFLSFFGKLPGRAISSSQCSFCRKVCSDGMSCSLWTCKVFLLNQVCTSRASSAASISTGVLRDSPRNGQDEVGKISVKSLRRFHSDFRPWIASCKVKALERCRRCIDVVELLLYGLHNLQKQNSSQELESEGIKNLYLLCKGRAVGKGQLVAIRKVSKCVFVCKHVCFCCIIAHQF